MKFASYFKRNEKALGIVHTYPEICENANFFLRIRLSATGIQHIFRLYLEIFENTLQSGNFFIRYEYVYVWAVVSGNLRIRLRHSIGSSIHGKHYKQTWRNIIALISILIPCVQINAAVINLHNRYFRDPSWCF